MSPSAIALSTLSIVVCLQYSTVTAFNALPTRALAFCPRTASNYHVAQRPLFMIKEKGDKKRRRIRRKVPIAEELVENCQETKESGSEKVAETISPTLDYPKEIEAKPREDLAVEFKIQDVRDVLAGKDSSSAEPVATNESDEDDDEWEYVDIDEEEDDEEYEYVIEDVEVEKIDSLEQLLVDARALREAEAGEEEEDEGAFKVPESVRNALSTIVTVDFFVVIALLLWFLAGIFSSSVLKDDAIQIAFNSNFQQIVQPALGILMIGSAASAVLKDEESEQEPEL